jgi:eukaryotic-like serine/threonine-protein kinase
VHRDIKPANILITTAGRVKILDFGLARVAARQTITRRGVILGTPDYMSPEQAMGRPVDRRGDLFSAGSVFYEFLGHEKPFKGKTLHTVLFQIVSEEPDPLLTVNPELPARLAAVVHRMMRKDPEKRYASMEEVYWALRGIHESLRRSSGRSALPEHPAPPGAEDARGKLREALARGRREMEAGRPQAALSSAQEALSLDPWAEDASEMAWRAVRARHSAVPPPPPPAQESPQEKRILALLARAAPGQPEAQARSAIAELSLIAPDDPRLLQLLRVRAGRE